MRSATNTLPSHSQRRHSTRVWAASFIPAALERRAPVSASISLRTGTWSRGLGTHRRRECAEVPGRYFIGEGIPSEALRLSIHAAGFRIYWNPIYWNPIRSDAGAACFAGRHRLAGERRRIAIRHGLPAGARAVRAGVAEMARALVLLAGAALPKTATP